jgi:hypothetical protein
MVVSNPLARRSKQFRILWNQRHVSNFVALLVLLITITTCGLEDPMYLHLFWTLCSKTKPWKWTDAHHKAFNKAKKIMAHDVMLAYPDFSKEFVIHMDASHTQLRCCNLTRWEAHSILQQKVEWCPNMVHYN